jgi:hypothetical protein
MQRYSCGTASTRVSPERENGVGRRSHCSDSTPRYIYSSSIVDRIRYSVDGPI